MEDRVSGEGHGFATGDLVRMVVVTLCLALLGLSGVLLLLPPTAPLSDALIEFNRPRLAKLAEHVDNGGTGVIMIGDSRLRFSTPLGDDAGQRLSTESGLDVQVVRLVSDWATFEDFAALTDDIKAVGPALVVIQEELLVKDRAVAVALPARRDYVLWRMFGVGPWNLGNRDHPAVQIEQGCDTLNPDTTVDQWRARLDTFVTYDAEGTNSRLLGDLVNELRAADAEVTFLQIPSTSIATAGLPQVENPRTDGRLTPESISIPDEHFCDLTHMNPEGRATYANWLIPELADRLETTKATL